MEKGHRIHIYPVDKRGRTKHWTAKHGVCWCIPETKQNCSESNERGDCQPGCWKCGGTGLVEPYNEEYSYLIIHKEEEENELCYPEKADEALGAK